MPTGPLIGIGGDDRDSIAAQVEREICTLLRGYVAWRCGSIHC